MDRDIRPDQDALGTPPETAMTREPAPRVPQATPRARAALEETRQETQQETRHETLGRALLGRVFPGLTARLERSRRTGVLRDGVRFLLAAFANAVLSMAVYQALLFRMTPGEAYALSWLCSLAFVIAVYPSQVFVEGRSGPAAWAGLTVSYTLVLVVGLASLEALTRLGMPPRLAIVLVMALTTLTNFTVGRALLRGWRAR